MLEEFAASRRTAATRKGYPKMMRLLIPDPDALLTKAKTDRRGAEDELISAIVRRRDNLSPASLTSSLSSLKSFFEFEEVPLNWKRVRSVAPAGKTVARDRAPTIEEIRLALRFASPRERTAILIMASGGLRIGGLPRLRLQDIEYLNSGLGRLRVYAGEREEYQTFVTPECVTAIRDYLSSRERIGEKLGLDSLVFRDKFDYQGDKRLKRISPAIPHSVNEHTIRTAILRLWHHSGVRKVNDGRPFKCDHGLRKFAKTQFSRAGISWENGEIMLGHSFNYNKPSAEFLELEYLRAVPFLSIGEEYALRSELLSKEEAHESQWLKARIENEQLNKKVSSLSELIQQLVTQVPGLLPQGQFPVSVSVTDEKISIKTRGIPSADDPGHHSNDGASQLENVSEQTVPKANRLISR